MFITRTFPFCLNICYSFESFSAQVAIEINMPLWFRSQTEVILYIPPQQSATRGQSAVNPAISTTDNCLKVTRLSGMVRRAGIKQQATNFFLILPLHGYNALTACFECKVSEYSNNRVSIYFKRFLTHARNIDVLDNYSN